MAQTKSVTVPKGRTKPKFNVGDLVLACDGLLVYMLVPCGNCFPASTGTHTVSGVLVHKTGNKDNDGDELPPIGYMHTNLGEDRLKLYDRAIQVWN